VYGVGVDILEKDQEFCDKVLRTDGIALCPHCFNTDHDTCGIEVTLCHVYQQLDCRHCGSHFAIRTSNPTLVTDADVAEDIEKDKNHEND